jgi:hypothetical protein
MGQRANLIILDKGEYTLYFDHSCADRLDEILFWGADYALDYFLTRKKFGDRYWLDNIWAEGGAVLDLDKNHLLWWGGEDIINDVILRRVHLKLQKKVWGNWTIEWAHRGIVDIAEYVGYPKEKLIKEKSLLDKYDFIPIGKKHINEAYRTLGVFKPAEGELKIFALFGDVLGYLQNGEDLLTQCSEKQGLPEIVFNRKKIDSGFLQGGFWIDEKLKTIEFWDVRSFSHEVESLKKIWKDREIIWQKDNFEFQVEKSDGKIVMPSLYLKDFIGCRRKILLADERFKTKHFIDKDERIKIWEKMIGETND